MGIGNFFGMLPEKMQESRLYGVELDGITGRIARQLYPKARKNKSPPPRNAPGHELEQMEAFQHAFYAEGRDVLDISVQLDIASRWGVEAAVFEAARADPAVRVRAEKEAAEASDIMGEFRLYPTLYLDCLLYTSPSPRDA